MHDAKSTEILREREVRARDGKSRTQRWRDIRAGRYPAPIQLGPNSIGWFEHEIEAWLASRPRVNYASQTPATPQTVTPTEIQQTTPHVADAAVRPGRRYASKVEATSTAVAGALREGPK